jgi:hypothetical protein
VSHIILFSRLCIVAWSGEEPVVGSYDFATKEGCELGMSVGEVGYRKVTGERREWERDILGSSLNTHQLSHCKIPSLVCILTTILTSTS